MVVVVVLYRGSNEWWIVATFIALYITALTPWIVWEEKLSHQNQIKRPIKQKYKPMTANNFTLTGETYYRVCHVMTFIGQHTLIKRVINIDDTDVERQVQLEDWSIIFSKCLWQKGSGEAPWVGINDKEVRRNCQFVCLLMDREMCWVY